MAAAFCVSASVAYTLMERWLEGFAYRVEVGAAPLVLAGIIALVVAGLTVSYQSVKTALTNPVESLRHE